MPVWLSAVILIVGISGSACCLTIAVRRKKNNARITMAVCAAAVFGIISVLFALYLLAAVLFLGGIS